MNQHESNDPRRGAREAAERLRQNLLSAKLLATICVLSVLVAYVVWRQYG